MGLMACWLRDGQFLRGVVKENRAARSEVLYTEFHLTGFLTAVLLET